MSGEACRIAVFAFAALVAACAKPIVQNQLADPGTLLTQPGTCIAVAASPVDFVNCASADIVNFSAKVSAEIDDLLPGIMEILPALETEIPGEQTIIALHDHVQSEEIFKRFPTDIVFTEKSCNAPMDSWEALIKTICRRDGRYFFFSASSAEMGSLGYNTSDISAFFAARTQWNPERQRTALAKRGFRPIDWQPRPPTLHLPMPHPPQVTAYRNVRGITLVITNNVGIPGVDRRAAMTRFVLIGPKID